MIHSDVVDCCQYSSLTDILTYREASLMRVRPHDSQTVSEWCLLHISFAVDTLGTESHAIIEREYVTNIAVGVKFVAR